MDGPTDLPKDHKGVNDDGTVSPGGFGNDIDKVVFRRALLKLDMFLLPAVTFIYFLNFLDRSVKALRTGQPVMSS